MSKMAEIDLDRQQIEQVRGDTRVIDWEAAKQRLHFIANGAEMASRNARALPFKPGWPTAAQDELHDAEQALEEALQKVREAMAIYDQKEIAV